MNTTSNQQAYKTATRWLRTLAKTSRLWVMLSICVGLTSGLLLIVEMYCLAHITYAAYIHQTSRLTLKPYFIAILTLIALRACLAYMKERVSFQASSHIRSALRIKLLSHINEVGPVVAGRLSTGAIVNALMEQVESLHDFFAYYLPQMSLAVLMPAAILAFVFPLSYVCGTILLVCAPLIPLFMALVGMGASSLQQKHFQTLSRMSSQFLDTIQGLVTLKLMGKGQSQVKKIFSSSDIYRIKIMQVLKVAFLSSAVLELFSAASIALVAVYLGLGFVNKGMHSHLWHVNLSLQSALFILLLAPEFFLPLRQLGTHYHAKAKAVGAAVEIAKVLSLKPTDKKDKVKQVQETWQVPKQLSLKVDWLTVRYQLAAKPALQDISIHVNAGEKLAVLGLSGSGKTTLFNCLLKFIDPVSGVITANDIDLQHIDSQVWHQSVSWVGQNPVLFRGTIRDNLLLAKPDASDDQLRHVLQCAQLNMALATQIGEQNAGLSGGQAQRLALARAYLKDAPLLLLDEPTASLDVGHEALVWSSLTSYWQDKTVLLSTHRLDHLDKMDRIVVISEGRLIKQITSREWQASADVVKESLYEIEEMLV